MFLLDDCLNFKVLKRVTGSKLTVFGRPTRPNASFDNSSWQRLPRWIFVRRGCGFFLATTAQNLKRCQSEIEKEGPILPQETTADLLSDTAWILMAQRTYVNPTLIPTERRATRK
jgi:hypothetical protein